MSNDEVKTIFLPNMAVTLIDSPEYHELLKAGYLIDTVDNGIAYMTKSSIH